MVESYAGKIFHKIKVVLANSIGLKNPDKLRYTDVKTDIIDVRVQPMQRSKVEDQEKYYNGSKKHIVKIQFIDNQKDNSIKYCQVELEGRIQTLKYLKKLT